MNLSGLSSGEPTSDCLKARQETNQALNVPMRHFVLGLWPRMNNRGHLPDHLYSFPSVHDWRHKETLPSHGPKPAAINPFPGRFCPYILNPNKPHFLKSLHAVSCYQWRVKEIFSLIKLMEHNRLLVNSEDNNLC